MVFPLCRCFSIYHHTDSPIFLHCIDITICLFINSSWTDIPIEDTVFTHCSSLVNCFVKGNVWSRNTAIRKFKDGKTMDGSDNKVIMLSLKNAASGTNLTEATHIFFVEPINKTREECKAIEAQAIARACRIGQKNTVNVVRILVADTIEETIYRKNYNNNAIVNITETTEKIIKSNNKFGFFSNSSEEYPVICSQAGFI